MFKTCAKCGIDKPVCDFRKSKSYPSGFRPRCRPCQNEDTREAYRKNPDGPRAKARRNYDRKKDRLKAERDAWRALSPRKKPGVKRTLSDEERYARKLSSRIATYQKNKEKVLAVSAIYRSKNKERERINRAAHYQANKDHVRIVTAAWRSKNKGKCLAYDADRRARKFTATPKWADLEAISMIYTAARGVTAETGIVHHVDHIVPLKSKWVCGLHCEANLMVIPGAENFSKSNRWWPDMPLFE